jgi:hypothetical protein
MMELAAQRFARVPQKVMRGVPQAAGRAVVRRAICDTPPTRRQLDVASTTIRRESYGKVGLIDDIHGNLGRSPKAVPYNPDPFAGMSNTELLRNTVAHVLIAQPCTGKLAATVSKFVEKVPSVVPVMSKVFEKTLFPVFFGGKNTAEMEQTIENNWEQGRRVLVDYAPENPSQKVATINYQKVLDILQKEVAPMVLKMAEKAQRNGQPRLAPGFVLKVSAIIPPDLQQRMAGRHPDSSTPEERERHPMRSEDNILRTKIIQQLLDIVRPLKEANVEVILDAELTWQNDVVRELASTLSHRGCPVTLTKQTYLRESENEATDMRLASSDRPKIVGGAYMRPERAIANAEGKRSPVVDTKEKADQQFVNSALHYLRSQSALVCTHSAERLNGVLRGVPTKLDNIELASLKGFVNLGEAEQAQKEPRQQRKVGLRTEYIPFATADEGLAYGLRRFALTDLGPLAQGQRKAHTEELGRRVRAFLFGVGES